MVRRYYGSVALLASLAAGAGVAGAADLAVKAPVYKAAPAYVSDWSGFYVGVNGGYGWGDTKFDNETKLYGPTYLVEYCDYFQIPHTDHLKTSLNGKPQGGLFGGHAGYNSQYGNVVAGVEVDFDGADIKDSGTLGTVQFDPRFGHVTSTINPTTFDRSIKFDELATVRARVGYLVLPDLLAYGTAGAGWGHSELTVSATNGGSTVTGTSDANTFGWVAGGGLEYKLWEHIMVRAEYLHYDFGKVSYGDFGNAKSTIDVARGGLSYKF